MRSRNFPSLVHALIALTCLFQFRLPLQAQDESIFRINITGSKVLAKVCLVDDPFDTFPANFRARLTIKDASILRFVPIPNKQSTDRFNASFNRPRTEATVDSKEASAKEERCVWVRGMQCGTTTITGTVIDLDDETLPVTDITYRVDVGSFRVLDPGSRALKQPHNVDALVLTPGQTKSLDLESFQPPATIRRYLVKSNSPSVTATVREFFLNITGVRPGTAEIVIQHRNLKGELDSDANKLLGVKRIKVVDHYCPVKSQIESAS